MDQRKVLLCGGCEGNNDACYVWHKAYKKFKLLESKLPVERFNDTYGEFDLVHAPPNNLFFRPWNRTAFWRGRIHHRDHIVWERKEPLEFPLTRGCAVLAGLDQIFVLGVIGNATAFETHGYEYLERPKYVNVSTGWKSLPSIPEDRRDFACLAYKKGVLVFDGVDQQGDYVDTIVFFSDEDYKWTEMMAMPKRTNPMKGAAFAILHKPNEEQIWSVGGLFESGKISKSIDFFKSKTENATWTNYPVQLLERRRNAQIVALPASWFMRCLHRH